MDSHIVFAYAFDGKGGAKPLKGDAVAEKLEAADLAWVHVDVLHDDSHDWLEHELHYLDPFIIDSLLAEGTRPRMQQIGDGAILFLRGVNMNENEDPEDMVSIRLYVDAHRIITMRRRKVRAVREIEDDLLAGKGPDDAGAFVISLIDRLFARIDSALHGLDDETDEIEERLIDVVDVSMREKINHVRKQAIMYRRYLAPQRDAIGQLQMADFTWLEAKEKRQMQESHNHVTRYIEDLDAIRDRAQIVKDELATMLADRLNKNMYILSVIAAVFLPLGFLTGLFGVNIGGMPGTDNGAAFYEFCVAMVVLVIAQIVIFKKLKWF